MNQRNCSTTKTRPLVHRFVTCIPYNVCTRPLRSTNVDSRCVIARMTHPSSEWVSWEKENQSVRERERETVPGGGINPLSGAAIERNRMCGKMRIPCSLHYFSPRGALQRGTCFHIIRLVTESPVLAFKLVSGPTGRDPTGDSPPPSKITLAEFSPKSRFRGPRKRMLLANLNALEYGSGKAFCWIGGCSWSAFRFPANEHGHDSNHRFSHFLDSPQTCPSLSVCNRSFGFLTNPALYGKDPIDSL